MIGIKAAEIKLYDEKGIEGAVAWIAYKQEEQNYRTQIKLGRGVMLGCHASMTMRHIKDGIVYFSEE